VFRTLSVRLPILLMVLLTPAYAVHWTSSQTGPSTWTYTLTIDPFDNYDISTMSTTITMTGLTGVTSATGPTSSDFPPPLATSLVTPWTAQVLNGGTKVVWTISTGGTGNFGTTQHIFGFSITAPGVASGTASFATNGFQVDGNGPIRDISGTVAGPTGVPSSIPAASGLTLLLLTAGLSLAGAYQIRDQVKMRLRR
jgi:hypothetical protein